ncbi:MAG: hypothetical protein ACK5RY_20920, partial [Dolichospermum sp.]
FIRLNLLKQILATAQPNAHVGFHASTQPTNQGFFQYRQGIVTYYIISNSLYSDIDVYDRYFSLG